MLNLATLKGLLERRFVVLSLVGIVLFAVIFSAVTLTTKPRVWVDEAITIELAQNFLRAGVLDIAVAPDTYSGLPQLVQSTGYPVTTLLAAAFSVFGPSLVVARVVMVVMLLSFLLTVLTVGRKFFGDTRALLAVLLIATFASLYGSRTAVGEIPGSLFLFGSLFLLFRERSYAWGGVLLGLAVVTKPAVFMLAVPAVAVALLIERREFFKRSFMIGLGALPAIAAWFVLVVGNPFSKEVWGTILSFYKNPYGGELQSNMLHNLSGFFSSTTLIYFGVLFCGILFARKWLKDDSLKPLYHFVIVYAMVAFFYYLRSPGWLRYILIAEFLILFLLPPALESIALRFEHMLRGKITIRTAVCATVLALSAVQLIQLFTAADLFYSDAAMKTVRHIEETYKGRSLAALDVLEVSTFLGSREKYQAVTLLTGILPMGERQWKEAKPEVVVFASGRTSSQEEQLFLQEFYTPSESLYGYEIYTVKIQ